MTEKFATKNVKMMSCMKKLIKIHRTSHITDVEKKSTNTRNHDDMSENILRKKLRLKFPLTFYSETYKSCCCDIDESMCIR